MRPALAALFLLAAACVTGSGIEPPSTPPDAGTGFVPTSTAAPPATVAGGRRSDAITVARHFLDAITTGDWDAAAALTIDPPSDLRSTLEGWWEGLAIRSASYLLTEDTVLQTEAVVGARLQLELEGLGPLEYGVQVRLVGSGAWGVAWAPSVLYPTLEGGDSLVVDRDWPTRGSIVATDGTPLATEVPVKVIGVVPRDIENIDALSADLQALAGISPGTVDTEISKPGVQPDWFVPVGTLELEQWEELADRITALSGVLVRDGTTRRVIESPFADLLIGTTGPITAEQLEALGTPYDATRVVGRSGLELALERTLAGTPNQAIRRVDGSGRTVETVLQISGRPSETVRITIDPAIQRAAETAVEGLEDPVALVVIDVPTGEVRASAVRPLDGFDRAFQGLYPPGSTFKIVTATALLDAGLAPDTEVACPGRLVIQGRTFRNAGGRDLGDITLDTAFAQSCNTTFAGLAAAELEAGDLGSAADAFGFNADYGATVATPGASFPDPPDLAGRAAAAIGQGEVLVTPLHQASIATAVASGGWRPPQLLDSAADVAPRLLDGAAAAVLDDMMRLVVTDGTGTAADVAGREVRGKTGSAEFGSGDDPRTHAWFVGYSGDLAFAVVVEGGGGGGAVAAPVAARFLEALAGSG